MPRFQDSLAGLTISNQWSSDHKEELQEMRTRSIEKAIQTYETPR
jgi:hypothetical protein